MITKEKKENVVLDNDEKEQLKKYDNRRKKEKHDNVNDNGKKEFTEEGPMLYG